MVKFNINYDKYAISVNISLVCFWYSLKVLEGVLLQLWWILQILEQRVENLERELDAAISASARARTEKRQAEAGQKAAELRAQEITRELENTTSTYTFLINVNYEHFGELVDMVH